MNEEPLTGTELKPNVLNSGLDVKNTMSKEEFQNVLVRTFTEVRDILSKHCGPFSQYAMVAVDDWSEPVFTKDGANIIRAFSYASKLQKILVKNLLYLGDREEIAAGDGTTSAMILGADGILNLINKFKDCPFTYTVAELEAIYNDIFVKKAGRYLDDHAWKVTDKDMLEDLCAKTELDERDVIYKLAYLQAYTSSHGNRTLAHVVATFFADNPREVWDYTTIESEKYETQEDISILKDDAQYTIEHVRLTPVQAYNKNLSTAYAVDPETEIIFFVDAPELGIQDHLPLIEKIRDAIENHKKMCVIMPDGQNGMSAQTAAFFEDLFAKSKCKTVGFVRAGLTQYDINDLTTLAYIVSNDLKPKELKGWEAELVGDRFYIKKGLYPEGSSGKNPFIGDEKNHQALNDYLNLVDNRIKELSMDRSKSGIAELVDMLNKFAIKIRTVGHTFVKLGGMQYDHLRNRDVVADAMIATRKALINGIVPGANSTLKRVLKIVLSLYGDNYETDKAAYFVVNLADALLLGIERIQGILIRSALEKNEDLRPEDFTLDKPGDLITLTNYDSVLDYLIKSKENPDLFMATEPVSMSKEFMKRFGDLALKFLKTETIIVPMSYYLPEEETKK